MYDGDVTKVDAGAATVSPRIALHVHTFAAGVVGAAFNGTGSHIAVGCADARVRVAARDGLGAGATWRDIRAPGFPLAIAADSDGCGFLVGTDAGVLFRVSPETGDGEHLTTIPGQWIEHVVAHPGRGWRAFAASRSVHVLSATGDLVDSFHQHPSTIAGLDFAPDGASIAAARYGGVSVWNLQADNQPRRELVWHGSHMAVSWSPNARFIVTATQEKELHLWCLETGKDLRMSGYALKPRSMSWTADSAFLAASGADTVTSWACNGDGPAGKPPLEFGYVFNGLVTNVRAHPAGHLVAAGYSDGTVLIGDILKGDAIIAKGKGGGAVTALDWSPDGRMIVAGTEEGCLPIMELRDEPISGFPSSRLA